MTGSSRLYSLLIGLGPLLLVLAVAMAEGDDRVSLGTRHVLDVLCAALVTIGGTMLLRMPRVARTLATAGLFGFLALASPRLLRDPALALLVLLAMLWLVMRLWDGSAPARIRRMRRTDVLDLSISGARTASLANLCVWALVVVWRLSLDSLAISALVISSSITLVFVLAWLDRERHRGKGRVLLLVLIAVLAIAASLLTSDHWQVSLSWLQLIPIATLVLTVGKRSPRPHASLWAPLLDTPARLLVATFCGLSALGTVLLCLPGMVSLEPGISAVDAAFTSTSAVCVTGLIVLDTPHDFTFQGQVVLLLLIQLGGLGIMTFSTATFIALGRRLSMRHERAAAGLLSSENRGALVPALRRLLIVTCSAEALGTLALTALFVERGEPFTGALWRGLFTTVSAFCNAGFALQSESLIPYARNPLVLHVVATLIVLGGLSPPVIVAIPALLRGRQVPVPVRLAVTVTLLLLAIGALGFGVLEWSGCLRDLEPMDRIHGAWFQSVTLRTAGFNSVDTEHLRPVTLLLMMTLMFIGGCPGGTAGGMKTVTLAILVLAAFSALRGRPQVEVFGRRISHRVVYKAAAIATVGTFVGGLALAALLVTQQIPSDQALFEVVSALGTVGLTIGGTAHLDAVGKLIIMGCMLAGRVGPLTLFLFLGGRSPSASRTLPEVEIDVG